MYYQVVFEFNEDESDPRYNIRPAVSEDARKDSTIAIITEQNGIALDNQGFPTLESLEAWHRKNNPHLFTE